MRIAIVGGALQGTEAVYLAKKAGYETFVIDKRNDAPALSLADEYAVIDPLTHGKEAMRIFEDCDAVLPACEELELLTRLDEMLSSSGIPLLFDLGAYRISSSKAASNDLMESIGIPIPGKWGECGYPVIVKPSSQSGSVGVKVAYSEKDVADGLAAIELLGDEPVIQEFVSGKSVSVEVIGRAGRASSYVTTEILLSENYDCKRVRCAPDILSEEREEEFGSIAVRTAERMCLNGLMDVEAIDTERGLRVLEIDARIPSQTPAAVLAATGINLLRELADPSRTIVRRSGASSYEHFVIKDGKMATCGEKEFAKVRCPRIIKGLFGSDEMITDYREGAKEWRCTMINGAADEEEVEKKRSRCIGTIMNECGLKEFADRPPEVI